MKIESKYNINQHIWVVYENRGEVCIYDDFISEICVGESGLYYMLKKAGIDKEEQDIILYHNKTVLLEKIEKVMNEIHKKEESEEEWVQKRKQ